MPVGLTRSLIQQLTRADIDISARMARVNDEGIDLVYQLQDLSQQGIDLPFLQRGEYAANVVALAAVALERGGIRIQAPVSRPIWIEEINSVSTSPFAAVTANVLYWAQTAIAAETAPALQAHTILAGPNSRSSLVRMTTATLPVSGGQGLIGGNSATGGFWVGAGLFFYVVNANVNVASTLSLRWKEPRLEE